MATNVVLSAAHASIVESTVTTTTGDVSVTATNTSGIDAKILSATTCGDTGVGDHDRLQQRRLEVVEHPLQHGRRDPRRPADLEGARRRAAGRVGRVHRQLERRLGGRRARARRQLGAAERDAEQRRDLRRERALRREREGDRRPARDEQGLVARRGVHRALRRLGRGRHRAAGRRRRAEHARDARPRRTARRADDASAGTAANVVTVTPGTNVLVGTGYGAADYTAGAVGTSRRSSLAKGENVTLADDYGAPTFVAVSLNAPGAGRCRPCSPGDRVLLTPFYGVRGTYETGSGTKTLKRGDTVVVSSGYTRAARPAPSTCGSATSTPDAETTSTSPTRTTRIRCCGSSRSRARSTSAAPASRRWPPATRSRSPTATAAPARPAASTATSAPDAAASNVGAQNYATDTRTGSCSAARRARPTATSAPQADLDVNGQNYTDTTKWALIGGTPGATYRFVGTGGSVDLNAENYLERPSLGADLRRGGRRLPLRRPDARSCST